MSKTKNNVILQTSYQVISLIAPFITAPYISRVLGNENVGIYSYTYSLVNYFVIISMLGLDIYGIREIAKVKDNQNKVNSVFTEIFIAHFLVSVIAILAYTFYCFFIIEKYHSIAYVQVFYILGATLNINWFFNGLGEFKVTVIRNMMITTLTVIAVFVFVKDKTDLFKYVSLLSVGAFLSTSAVWIVRSKYVNFTKVTKTNVFKHYKPLLILFISIIAGSIMRMIDKTMLGSFGYISELGCYEYADKIIRMPLAIITGIGTVMMSKISNMISKENDANIQGYTNLTVEYVSHFSFFMIVGFIIFGTQFSVLYFGSDFIQTGYYLRILSVSLLFISICNTIRTQYFIPYRKDTSYAVLTGVGSLINIIINAILIPVIGGAGAAIATDITYFIMLIASIVISSKVYSIRQLIKFILYPTIVAVFPLIICSFLKKHFMHSTFSFILLMIIYIIIYASSFIIYRLIRKKHNASL